MDEFMTENTSTTHSPRRRHDNSLIREACVCPKNMVPVLHASCGVEGLIGSVTIPPIAKFCLKCIAEMDEFMTENKSRTHSPRRRHNYTLIREAASVLFVVESLVTDAESMWKRAHGGFSFIAAAAVQVQSSGTCHAVWKSKDRASERYGSERRQCHIDYSVSGCVSACERATRSVATEATQ